MACFSPLKGYKAIGSEGITFDKRNSAGIKMQVPCGQCIGCRLEHSRAWALRCVHEAQLHDENCFLTLTYEDEKLPQYGGLEIEHWQKFVKKLRKHLAPRRIRYFHCGEYGEQYQRPHYHALIFGWTPCDKQLHSTKDGINLYVSPMTQKLWGRGFVTIGELNFQTAAYTARYTMKKLGGERYFQPAWDFSTGEINELPNVYATMSRRPGIGADWIKQYKSDVYPWDHVIHEGLEHKTPRFYDKYLESTHQEEYESIKEKRKARMREFAADNTPERLAVRERITYAKINKSERTL